MVFVSITFIKISSVSNQFYTETIDSKLSDAGISDYINFVVVLSLHLIIQFSTYFRWSFTM